MSVGADKQVMALEVADRMLAEVASVDEAQKLIDKAEQARVLARQLKLGTSAMNHAMTIKLRAERKLADIVDEGQRSGEIHDGRTFSGNRYTEKVEGALSAPSTFEELGLRTERVAEARLLRDAFTEEDLAERQRVANERDEILSRASLIQEARRMNAVNTAVQTERVNLLYPVFEALEALANVPLSPADFAARVPSYNAKQVNAHIDQAANWLAQFTEEWNATQQRNH